MPVKSTALIVSLTLAAFEAGCSGSPSSPSSGHLTVTAVTAVGSINASGAYSYTLTFTVQETGDVDVTVLSIDARAYSGTTVLAGVHFGNGFGFAVPKNGSYHSAGQYVIDDTFPFHPYADTILVTLNYADIHNNSGSASATGTTVGKPM
jgi:hypothetical protein